MQPDANTLTPPALHEVTFYNVTITIPATDGPRAYAELCTVLGTVAGEWVTDTYEIHDESGRVIEEGETDALWPER
jgi:hypothetical protein